MMTEAVSVRRGYSELKFVVCAFALVMTLVTLLAPGAAWADDEVAMHRLCNPYTGEHFYTGDVSERNDVMHAGWRYEGVGWAALASGEPVYRLYNPYAGDHHYTMDASERDSLAATGWTDEGTGWFSDGARRVPLYRQYNPNEFSCNHNYTAAASENSVLVAAGWREEGIAWYGVSYSADDPAAKRTELMTWRNAIQDDMNSNWLMAGSVMQMKEARAEYIRQYQQLIDDAFCFLVASSPTNAASLQERENEWEADVESSAQRISVEEYGHTSLTGLAYLAEKLQRYDQHALELIDMIS